MQASDIAVQKRASRKWAGLVLRSRQQLQSLSVMREQPAPDLYDR